MVHKRDSEGGLRNKLIRAIPLFLLIGLVGAIVYGYLDNPLMQQMITEAALSRLQPITDADNGKTISVKTGDLLRIRLKPVVSGALALPPCATVDSKGESVSVLSNRLYVSTAYEIHLKAVKAGTTTLKVLKPDSRNEPVETFVITVSVMQ